jgi:excinuclease ABC B subunit
MEKFKLVSDYQPCGDQPKAIKDLADSISSGERYQTLLGVTGSGKSLPAEEPILVYHETNGKMIPMLVPIGTFVELFFKKQTPVSIQNDIQIVLLDSTYDRYYALSVNSTTLETQVRPITAVHRHLCPKTLWKIVTTCGRSVRVTRDHNLWVLRKGELKLLETDKVDIGDYLPLPLSLPKKETKLDFVSLLDVFEGDRNIFVYCQEELAGLSSHDMWQLGKVIRPDAQEKGYSKLWRVAMDRERISVADIQSLKSAGVAFDLESSKAGVRNRQREIPLTIPITEALLELIGYFLAEGHAEDKFFMISCAEREVQVRLEHCLKNLGLTWSVRHNGYDYQISWSIYARLFAKWCGPRSKEKRMPYFWPQLNQSQLSLLLSAYFTGDGGVEHDEVTVTTASQQLASELAYALTQFGLWPRIAKRFKRATNSAHKGSLYYRLSISGAELLKLFAENIDFLSERKRVQLTALLGKNSNTNVDVIPVSGKEIKRLRIELGCWQKTLAQQAGCQRSLISLIESENRRPSRTLFEKLMKIFEAEARKRGRFDLLNRIACLRQLSLVRWTPVSSISQESTQHAWVYDLSVSENETFLAGFGGLFVHNTFTLANVIAKINLPTLVISHNKTLAAQLYSEFKDFFPHNAVEYFVSYYDYYQPEAYIPATDTYIEKDASINDRLDRLRLSATTSLMSRNDVLIVASVSCIYNLGSPEDYQELLIFLEKGQGIPRDELIAKFIQIQYERNDYEFIRGRLRVRGDCLEVYPSYQEKALRIEFLGDRIEKISEINPITAQTLNILEKIAIYPAKHFIVSGSKIDAAIQSIKLELEGQLKFLRSKNKLLEAQRLESRTNYDIEMLKEIGYCHGIENYSRHLSGRPAGFRPYSMIDYFKADFLTIIDESHASIPQIRGMYEGDRARKEVLVEYGFRLPSCLDNRPLKFEEFNSLVKRVVFVSATPAEFEIKKSQEKVIEQLIRPTGLVDPQILVKPTENQIEDLIEEIKRRAKNNERVLVTTLTKRMAEDLTNYLQEKALKVKYLHSDIQTIERSKILKGLRLKDFDCLVGINLLREGLDLPEVSLVAILDADKEGFLRSETSLIQVSGRASRNIHGTVIMYADTLTGSMKRAITESIRRRKIQLEFNQKNKITPRSIQKAIRQGIEDLEEVEEFVQDLTGQDKDEYELNKYISELEYEMELAARNLQFEKAAVLRDKIKEISKISRDGSQLKAKVSP